MRQMHNHFKKNEYHLRIRNVRQRDFGEYECNVYVNDTRLQRSATLNVTGKVIEITKKNRKKKVEVTVGNSCLVSNLQHLGTH